MSATINRKAMSAFLLQCLDPLPDAVLIDTQHNHLMRKARGENWRKASFVTDLAEAEAKYLLAKNNHARWVLGDAVAADEVEHRRHRVLKGWRHAIAEQIRASAPDRLAVQWKRAAAKDDSFLPIKAAEIAALIAADEAFLAAHPITKQPRRRAVRSRD